MYGGHIRQQPACPKHQCNFWLCKKNPDSDLSKRKFWRFLEYTMNYQASINRPTFGTARDYY